MGLFSAADKNKIDAVARASNETAKNPVKSVVASPSKAESELRAMEQEVQQYFEGSPAILIETAEQLSDYIDKCIDYGYAGIDTETTGLDRVFDTVVGASLYVPGQFECYIPMKHIGLYTDSPIKGQLTYEAVGAEFQRLVDNKVKLIFANADFDLAMVYKDLKVDLVPAFYYDVILAWRCLKEDEKDNTLKGLYNKYVLKGKGDPKKFRDFFSPKLFPYSKPKVAALYAANDAKITFDLFKWQLPYTLKDNEKCKKHNLEAISDLIWGVEFPLVPVCQQMHRDGMYIDKDVANMLSSRYSRRVEHEEAVLAQMVDDILSNASFRSNSPFRTGKDFNPKSPKHVAYLLYDVMNIPVTKYGQSTDKNVLHEINLPVTNQILKVRSLWVLISTFVEKLPKATTPDSRIHAQFRQIGADTGRFSSAEPNLQNIPSRSNDIRHMFRATAAKSDVLDCEYLPEIEEIKVSTSKFNRVETSNGEVTVENLNVGDSVKLLEDGKEVWRDVKAISTSSKDTSIRDVVF